MSELISRLKEIIEKYNAGCYNETCNPFESCTDCVLKQIREVIESQPPADQWIPCSKQEYPTEEGWYWITGKYDGWEEPETRLLVYAANVCGEFEWLKKQFELYNVTAWMPATLPEPYKGE